MKRILRPLSVLAAAAAAFAASAGSVTISLDAPKQNVERKHSGTKKTSLSFRRNMTEKSTSATTVDGRIMGMTGRGETMDVFVEVYFVSRGIGENPGPEKIDGPEIVGRYTFGKGHPAMHAFSATSPKYSSSVKTVRSGNHRRNRTERTKTGRRLSCIIVRAISGGKVIRAITEPHNPKWEAAAKNADLAADCAKGKK